MANRSLLIAPLLLLLLCACGGSAPLSPKAIALNQQGLVALAEGDLSTAEASFSVALEYHPSFVEALVNLGLTELARGNHDRARTLFLRARRINADLPHPHHALGVLAERQGHVAEASTHYREALRVDPGFVPARANLARSLFEAGMLDEARAQFLRLTQLAPEDDRGPAGLTETLLKQRRVDEASEVIASAIERVGETPSLRLLAARRLLDAGQVSEAREALRALSSERSSVSVAARAWLAVACLADGDAQGALENAEAALQEDRFEPVATYALGEALALQGDAAAAAWKARARKAR